MEKRKSPNAFIVVLPGEIIEIPQNSDKSWRTLFYSLPRELAEKWKPAYDLPRCPYEVLRMDKYDHIVCDDMLCVSLSKEFILKHPTRAAASGDRTSAFPMILWVLSR